jgi:hypothetical protein
MHSHDERVTVVFEAAVLLERAERLSFVGEACADDPALQRQVEVSGTISATGSSKPPDRRRFVNGPRAREASQDC